MPTRMIVALLIALTLSDCGASAAGRPGARPSPAPTGLSAKQPAVPLAQEAIATRPTRASVSDAVAPRLPAPTWTPDFRPAVHWTPAPTITPVTTLPAAAFGFVFTYGACVDSRVDTFAGTFHRDGSGSAAPVTVPLSLTAEDMQRIQRAVDQIGFFGYPAEFTLRPPVGTGGGAMVAPSDHYTFQVREGAKEHAVHWDDDIINIASARADRLRDLADLIERTAHGSPAVAALPPFVPGCA